MTNAVPAHPSADWANRVEIVEVGARDGLQNEVTVLETGAKVDLIERAVNAGSRRIEVASFVHPARVPQMADAESVVSTLGSSPAGVSYIGLVLNRRGLDRAVLTTVDEINFVVGASKGFNEANAGVSPDVTMSEIESMIPDAGDRRTTVTISVAFGCPYEGEVPLADVVRLAELAANAGADEIALGDTIGVAAPRQVVDVIAAVREVADVPLRLHFHDTRNTAVANVVAATLPGSAPSTRRSAVPVGARSLQRPPGTSRPKTCSTCSTGWASRRESGRPRPSIPPDGSRRNSGGSCREP